MFLRSKNNKNLVQFSVFNPYYTINIQVIRNDLPCIINVFDNFDTNKFQY